MSRSQISSAQSRKRKLLSVEGLEARRLLAIAVTEMALDDLNRLAIAPAEYSDSRILVRFREEAAREAKNFELPGAIRIVNSYDFLPELHEIELGQGMDVQGTLDALRGRPDVLYAEPDYQVHSQNLPNDPQFGRLWGMDNSGQTGGVVDADVDAVEAWDKTTGSGSVVVAIIDSGVDYTHPDLAANIWTNAQEVPDNGRDDDSNGYVDDIHGYDFANRDGDPKDDHFHGTHVAGTIGAVGNNGIGVSGVSWRVQIMALKFLDSSGNGYISDAIAALNYAVANGAKISNNSWAGGGYSQAMYDAIGAAGSANHVFVAAAGNESSNNDQVPAYPSSYDLPNVISVTSIDHSDQLAYFSNVGKRSVDVGAPGVGILSTFPTYLTVAMQTEGLSQNYESISGTSMSTPHVAGLAALIYDQHPDWSGERVIEQITSTVDPISALTQTSSGGRINAAAAVGNPAPDTRGPRVARTNPSSTVSGSVSKVSVTFSESIASDSFSVDDISQFVGAGGIDLLNQITGVSGTGRDFTISFNTQTLLGNYELVLGPDILDDSGNLMDQDADGNLGEPRDDQYRIRFAISEKVVVDSGDVPKEIPNRNIMISTLTIAEDVFVGDLDVELDVTHEYDGEIALYLFAPNDLENYVLLSLLRGDSGRNYTGTVFDDEADVPIDAGTAPFARSFRPETPLSLFDGRNARGEWQLWIVDIGGFYSGHLNSWTLMIQPGGGSVDPPTPVNHPPEPSDDYAQTNEDTSVTVRILANDRDVDGDSLALSNISNVLSGTAIVNADNTVTFTPDLDFNYFSGSAGFTYTISDGRGGSATANAWIDVIPVNDAPVAVDDLVEGTTNQPIVFGWSFGSSVALEANDLDVDGDWLWIESVGNARHGTVSIGPSGEVVFTPEQDYSGTASFEYVVTDGTLSDPGLVRIQIGSSIYLSTSTNGELTNSDGSTLQFAHADILRMTSDASGDYRFSVYLDGSDVGLTADSENIDAFTFLPDGSILISTVGAFSVSSYGYIVTGRGEDLIQFWPQSLGNDTNGYWNLYFDGSNVGLSGVEESLDSVSVLNDGRVLISTAGNVRVPGGITGVDEDLLAFSPYSLGENYTSGSWAMYFDGSDVGLGESDGEDIDGLFARESLNGSDPTLYFSTRGAFDAGGISGENEDIFAFNPAQLGNTTLGSYASPLALDGSQFGLADLNIDGFYFGRPVSQSLGLAAARAWASEVRGDYSVSNVSMADSPVLIPSEVDGIMSLFAPPVVMGRAATNLETISDQPLTIDSAMSEMFPTQAVRLGSQSIDNPATVSNSSFVDTRTLSTNQDNLDSLSDEVASALELDKLPKLLD